MTLRRNAFWSDISDPVANVTLTHAPTLITRQKDNLGVTQAQVSAAYLSVNSAVLSYSANPALQGNFLPQMPQNQFAGWMPAPDTRRHKPKVQGLRGHGGRRCRAPVEKSF